LDNDDIGSVAAFHKNHLLLIACARERSFYTLCLYKPEKPHDKTDQPEAGDIDNNLVPSHDALHRLSRLALPITVTELNDMAIAARRGERRMPKSGYNTPSATGKPKTL